MTPDLRRRLTSPAAMLFIAIGVVTALALVPACWTDPLRTAAADGLKPGQVVAASLRQYAGRLSGRVRTHLHTASRLAEAEEQLQRLREENQRLAAELAAAEGMAARAKESSGDDGQVLLGADCIPAHVLGRQARSFLARRRLLDVGTQAGAETDALVLDRPALVDRGADAGLGPDLLVLSGRRVWGKVLQAGAWVSVVRTMTEAGYRDLVEVGKPGGPRGILEGTGETLARVRRVGVTEPVAVGDPVFAAAEKGILPAPVLYGRIVRLERPAAAAHWEVWVEPAIADEPDRVAVLRTRLNPARVPDRPQTNPR